MQVPTKPNIGRRKQIEREWWKNGKRELPLQHVIQSYDTAFMKKTADFSAISTGVFELEDGGPRFVIGCLKDERVSELRRKQRTI